MTTDRTADPAGAEKKAGKDTGKTRDERLAEALRANLRRRKTAAKKDEKK